MLASSSLLKLTTVFWNNFSGPQTLELRDYVLRYLANRTARLPPLVRDQLIQTMCRITKLGWYGDPGHREICASVTLLLKVGRNDVCCVVLCFAVLLCIAC